ncbi:MAG: ABC transporter substrate-binding protein [Candidatus Nezhaarchaeales archaeon]
MAEKVSRRTAVKAIAAIVVCGVAAGIGAWYAGLIGQPPRPVVEEVKIGTVWPLSGPLAPSGEKHLRGVQLRVEEVNRAGGIKSLGGAKVKLVVADNQDDPKLSASETERLITVEKIVGFIGCYTSGSTLPATEVTERYGIPAVVCAGSPAITGRGFKYVFRAHSEVFKTAKVSFEFLKQIGVKTAAIVMDHGAYGTTSKRVCEALAPRYGIEIVHSELFPTGTTDLSPTLLKVKEKAPDALIAVAYITDALLMMRQMREYDVNVKVLIAPGGAGFNDLTFIKEGGKLAEYVLIGIYWSPDAGWPHNAEFVKHYTEVYKEPPDALAEEAYEAAYVLLDAIERAGSTDPSKIREALVATDTIWIAGPIKFSKPGEKFLLDPMLKDMKIEEQAGENVYDNVVVVQIQDGKFVTVWPESTTWKGQTIKIASAKPRIPMPTWKERGL